MMNTHVGHSTHGLEASHARRSILAQHQRLRGVLQRAQKVADAALEGTAADPDAVATTIGELSSVMEGHLSFEEGVLLPILNADLPLGPARAAELTAEHEQQRAMLNALHRQAGAAPRVPTLATQLMFLIDWLLADMSHEETELMAPGVFCDVPDC